MANLLVFATVLITIGAVFMGSFILGFIASMIFTNDNATDTQLLSTCWIITAICLGTLIGCLIA